MSNNIDEGSLAILCELGVFLGGAGMWIFEQQ